ncbi:endolytic transglycosylase MltG [Candidatus Amesbacteria bacterium]|nr:endolytic transglycosylase MltG [Candidatus Amesbacteria bacterium]
MKFWIGLISISISFSALVYAGMYWWKIQLTPVNITNKSEQTLVIANNESANLVLQKLVNQRLIRSYWVAKLYLQGQGLDQSLRPGSYSLSQSLSLSEIFETLTSGPKDIWVTIPEGYRREQIAQKFANFEQFDSREFIVLTASSEGRLFPDTYLVPLHANAKDVVSMMSKNFGNRIGEISDENLILASLVEREVRENTDRKIVAGIILKRLKASWPLQIDATIQYALGNKNDWWPKNIDTEFESKYNTYLNSGLPPTPIANPGIESINAVLKPTESEYWYYLNDTKGVTHFAKTLAEHNLNVDKYLSD